MNRNLLPGRRRPRPRAQSRRGKACVVGRRHAPIVRRALLRATDRRWHVPPCEAPALRGRLAAFSVAGAEGDFAPQAVRSSAVPEGTHVRSAPSPAAFVSFRYAGGRSPGCSSRAKSRSHGGRTATAINPSAEASCLSCLSVLEWSRVLTMCLSGGRRDSPRVSPDASCRCGR